MKTSDSISFASQVPSLFQIAAFFEDFFPDGQPKPFSSPARHLPIAEFMLNPEKLLGLLKSGKSGGATATATPEKSQRLAKKAARNPSLRKPAGVKKDHGALTAGQPASSAPD